MIEDFSVEFDALPPPLRDVALRMLHDLNKTYDLGGLTSRDIASVIAAPSFRSVLEDEARLNSLALASA